jgi:hypothetical protein
LPLPFKKGGRNGAASFDDGNEVTWKNNYSKMYPAGEARIIETVVTLSLQHTTDGIYRVTIKSLYLDIVFLKVIVEDGEYEQINLKMPERLYERQ